MTRNTYRFSIALDGQTVRDLLRCADRQLARMRKSAGKKDDGENLKRIAALEEAAEQLRAYDGKGLSLRFLTAFWIFHLFELGRLEEKHHEAFLQMFDLWQATIFYDRRAM